MEGPLPHTRAYGAAGAAGLRTVPERVRDRHDLLRMHRGRTPLRIEHDLRRFCAWNE